VSDPAFSNDPIDVSSIPRIRDDDFVAVDPNFLRVSLLGYAIWAVIVLAAGIVVAIVVPSRQWIPLVVMGGVLLLTALSLVSTVLGVRNIGYQVREHDVSYRHGILFKSVQTVPFVRVQHARVSQGPVQRAFGIAVLAVNSAGPDLNIAGLSRDDAERLRAPVVERAGELVEET